MSALLEAPYFVKALARVRAVDGISVEVTGASCFGLLGPNRPGKTTTRDVHSGS